MDSKASSCVEAGILMQDASFSCNTPLLVPCRDVHHGLSSSFNKLRD